MPSISGFTTGSGPVAWGAIDSLFANLTIPVNNVSVCCSFVTAAGATYRSGCHVCAHQLVVPSLIVFVEQDPQEAERQNQSGNPFADPFPKQHRHEPCRCSILFDHAHPKYLFAWGRSAGKQHEHPDDVIGSEGGLPLPSAHTTVMVPGSASTLGVPLEMLEASP